MNTRAERRRAERAIRKEAGRAARWLEGIPEPTMAAARRLAAELLGRDAAEPATSQAARPTVELLVHARDFDVPVEHAAELVRSLRKRGLATITAGGAIEITEEQSARIEALAEEVAPAELDTDDEADIEPSAPPVPLTKKGVKALGEMVWPIADKSGHSVEQVTLALCDRLIAGARSSTSTAR